MPRRSESVGRRGWVVSVGRRGWVVGLQGRAGVAGVECIDRVGDGHLRGMTPEVPVDLQQAADIAGQDRLGSGGQDVPHFAFA